MEKTNIEFEQVIALGCGIDVHKKVLVATIRGTNIVEETREYASYTDSIDQLRQWLLEIGIKHMTNKN